MEETNKEIYVHERQVGSHMMKFDPADIIQQYLEKDDQELQEFCKLAKTDTEVSIGVIGEAHSGKSSCINAIRGLGPRDKGAAPVSSFECVRELTAYPFPSNPRVIFWDLPGVGTTDCPRQTYMDKIDISR